MGKFSKLRKNRKYNYTPRYYDDKGEGSPFKMQPKLDKYRTTINAPRGLKGKFSNAMADIRSAGDRNLKLRMLIIIAILILLFLYIIDFDLSIFYSK
ncbi:riboflavin synthase subunit beta [uncultured Eudoraea sp.]|jgi:hypothetical protein|uniref:riboflavin synthase subunit beta n=1 Tax=uncultured Eudoraea sp. TaxID=1035614 RepID=UPI002603F5AC|nr:riboflavin synthase subunit beta [uncultured Eudoraea sp.]